MKAIVNVDKNHSYYKWNGLTYDMVMGDINNHVIILSIENHSIPFELTDVIICDLQSNMKKYYNSNMFTMLEKYVEVNNIKYNYPF